MSARGRPGTIGRPRHSASALLGLAIALSTAQMPVSAGVVYRWTDDLGRTHYSETVPEPYRDRAKPMSAPAANPTEAQQREAQDRAAGQKRRASEIGRAASTPASAPAPGGAAPVAKRPAQVPDERTDCETWARLYRESLDCFGPYRTTRGATREEAFAHCTTVPEPPSRCRARVPD